jgi:hypothetical protein
MLADVAYWPFSEVARCPSCVRNAQHNGRWLERLSIGQPRTEVASHV